MKAAAWSVKRAGECNLNKVAKLPKSPVELHGNARTGSSDSIAITSPEMDEHYLVCCTARAVMAF